MALKLSSRSYRVTALVLVGLVGVGSCVYRASVFRPAKNFHVVDEGKFYRSAQLRGVEFEEAVKTYGIKTVINLRGERIACGSDRLGRIAAQEAGLTHIDAPFESRGAPHKDRILRLAKILEDAPEPILIHCKSGADRTGLVAGIWLLLQGRPVAEAAAQLSLRHGHVSQSKTGILDAFFAEYARAWPKPFLAWLAEDYDEAALRAGFASRPWADRVVDGILRRE
jgi:uncharacterized protein (TIGR01244 family)